MNTSFKAAMMKNYSFVSCDSYEIFNKLSNNEVTELPTCTSRERVTGSAGHTYAAKYASQKVSLPRGLLEGRPSETNKPPVKHRRSAFTHSETPSRPRNRRPRCLISSEKVYSTIIRLTRSTVVGIIAACTANRRPRMGRLHSNPYLEAVCPFQMHSTVLGTKCHSSPNRVIYQIFFALLSFVYIKAQLERCFVNFLLSSVYIISRNQLCGGFGFVLLHYAWYSPLLQIFKSKLLHLLQIQTLICLYLQPTFWPRIA